MGNIQINNYWTFLEAHSEEFQAFKYKAKACILNFCLEAACVCPVSV